MIARSVAVGNHPRVHSTIQVDGGNATIRRFEQRQAARSWSGERCANNDDVADDQRRGTHEKRASKGPRPGVRSNTRLEVHLGTEFEQPRSQNVRR
jgi:hypothetical protein